MPAEAGAEFRINIHAKKAEIRRQRIAALAAYVIARLGTVF